VIGTAVIVLWLALSPDKAAGLQTVFTVLGLMMLLTTPLVLLIPDRARERHQADARAEQERTEAEVAAARASAELSARLAPDQAAAASASRLLPAAARRGPEEGPATSA
jgi:hypothetical protein